ncbi:MAG TPA: class I SAM-dependent methyltransferase [Panacibacter sp.]|nr:class I SAM-dependent methyltransferase [Panacibacter sp.]
MSKEIFSIWHCNDCTGRFTQNIPAGDAIGPYYQSADYISHSDTKKGFINRVYHIVRNYTLQSKRKLIEKVAQKNNDLLLDVGAGTGAFADTMQLAGWNVTGLEPDTVARENALKNHGLVLQSLDALFTFSAKKFDIITMWHVLEHVHQLHNYIKTYHSILKDDGTLIIAVPNYTSHDAAVYKEYWAAYDVPRHLYHFSPESMQQLMQQHGFAVKEYKPMWFDSFYVSILSGQYKTGSGNLLKAMWNGFVSNLKAVSDAKKCSSVIYIIRKENGK